MAVVRPFEELVEEHGAVVMRVCRALLPAADAEDAWAETFLAALRAYPRLRPGSNVRGLARHDRPPQGDRPARAAGRRPVPAGDLPDVPTSDPVDDTGGLRAALAALPPKQRGAVVAHYLAGLPYAEVATVIDSSEAAARRSAADGIASLRRSYQEDAPT